MPKRIAAAGNVNKAVADPRDGVAATGPLPLQLEAFRSPPLYDLCAHLAEETPTPSPALYLDLIEDAVADFQRHLGEPACSERMPEDRLCE
jgi:hypothetical protein